jgi:maltose-binding protein MalE
MKTLTVRVPAATLANIRAESRRRRVTQSEVVRERLDTPVLRATAGKAPTLMDLAHDLIGSVAGDGLPRDLAANKKAYLREWGYGWASTPTCR